jgi:hypothetical protein
LEALEEVAPTLTIRYLLVTMRIVHLTSLKIWC